MGWKFNEMERKEIVRRVEAHSTPKQYLNRASAYFKSASILIESSTQTAVSLELVTPILTLLGIAYELTFKAWKLSKGGTVKEGEGHDLIRLLQECIGEEIPFVFQETADRVRQNIRGKFWGSSMIPQLNQIAFDDHFHNLNETYGKYPYLARYPVSQRLPLIDVELLCGVGQELCNAICPHCLGSKFKGSKA